MKQKIFFITILFICHLHSFSQKKISIFYDSGVTALDSENKEKVRKYLNTIDLSKLESIFLIAYTDNTGASKTNDILSKKRADILEKFIEKEGIDTKLDAIYQGEVITDIKDIYSSQHNSYLRKKDRKIDIIPNYKEEYAGQDIHSLDMKFDVSENTRAGERIYLQNMTFPDNKSVLTKEMQKELDKLAFQLQKHRKIELEIQGHICCTPNDFEAIDQNTGKKELSTNRAKAVYNYLIKRGVEPNRLQYKGYGTKRPLGLDSELDRRVELLILKV